MSASSNSVVMQIESRRSLPKHAAPHGGCETRRYVVALASERHRDVIAQHRHNVYSLELGQYSANDTGRIRDALDTWNVYLVAQVDGEVAGFISITPPKQPAYSIDKYFSRAELPFAIDEHLCEVRLLTVLKPHRGREVASLLMYAALRWVEAHGGSRIVAIGRRELIDLYMRVGLKPLGMSTRAGAVIYDLMLASVEELRARSGEFIELQLRLEEKTDWRLPFPFRKPAACFHGGAFFTAVGDRFDSLDRSQSIINADVLDAWFPPAPGALAALREHLEWLLRTSPPTGCAGFIDTVANTRNVAAENILPGAGSSDLIYRALRYWLTPASRALILDPTYGEYAHVLERVIGCTVERLFVTRKDNYTVDPARLEAALAGQYDLIVLVNPNSPTGQCIQRAELERVLRCAPVRTRIWVDETYVDYAGDNQSLEHFAANSENVIVCKSMSKAYALSGARVAYMCAGAHQLEGLRGITPPWVVSLPAQVAAVRALQDPEYYQRRYQETAILREDLAQQLRSLGLDVLLGVANFLLCHLPDSGPTAAVVVESCRQFGLFLRDAAVMGTRLGTHALRVAVKDAAANDQIVSILRRVLVQAE